MQVYSSRWWDLGPLCQGGSYGRGQTEGDGGVEDRSHDGNIGGGPATRLLDLVIVDLKTDKFATEGLGGDVLGSGSMMTVQGRSAGVSASSE